MNDHIKSYIVLDFWHIGQLTTSRVSMCSLLGAVICIHLLIIKGYKMHTQILISLSPCMDDLSYKRIAGNFTFMFMSKKKEREIIQSDHSRIKIEIRLNKIDNLLEISYPA